MRTTSVVSCPVLTPPGHMLRHCVLQVKHGPGNKSAAWNVYLHNALSSKAHVNEAGCFQRQVKFYLQVRLNLCGSTPWSIYGSCCTHHIFPGLRILISWGWCNKVPQTGWLISQKFIFSQLWMMESLRWVWFLVETFLPGPLMAIFYVLAWKR